MYAFGDVVRGKSLPADDGQGPRAHYALVIGTRRGVPVVAMGTSLKDPEELYSRRPALLIVSPRTAAQHWAETGLVKPTLFDLESAERRSLTPEHCAKWQVSVVGSVKNVGAWRRVVRLLGD